MPTFTSALPRAFLARNSSLDTDLALAALEINAAASTVTYAFSLRVSPADVSAANAIGQARTALAVARGRNDGTYRRGAQDERIDTDGALAELVLFAILDSSEAVCAPLVAFRPGQGADIQLAGLNFDVKSVSRGKALICINEKSHKRGAADAYLIAKIVADDTIDVFLVSRAGVDGWPVKAGFSPYRAVPVPGGRV